MTTTAKPAADATRAPDPQAAVLRLLLQATSALARAGQAERACRIAAAAWAALREPRPDLAANVTVALHGLTRHVEHVPDRPGPSRDCPQSDQPRSRATFSAPVSAGREKTS